MPRGLSFESFSRNVHTWVWGFATEGTSVPYGSICVICNDEYQTGNIVCKIQTCDHTFHHQCITQWWARSTRCPICNNNLVMARVRVSSERSFGTSLSLSRSSSNADSTRSGLVIVGYSNSDPQLIHRTRSYYDIHSILGREDLERLRENISSRSPVTTPLRESRSETSLPRIYPDLLSASSSRNMLQPVEELADEIQASARGDQPQGARGDQPPTPIPSPHRLRTSPETAVVSPRARPAGIADFTRYPAHAPQVPNRTMSAFPCIRLAGDISVPTPPTLRTDDDFAPRFPLRAWPDLGQRPSTSVWRTPLTKSTIPGLGVLDSATRVQGPIGSTSFSVEKSLSLDTGQANAGGMSYHSSFFRSGGMSVPAPPPMIRFGDAGPDSHVPPVAQTMFRPGDASVPPPVVPSMFRPGDASAPGPLPIFRRGFNGPLFSCLEVTGAASGSSLHPKVALAPRIPQVSLHASSNTLTPVPTMLHIEPRLQYANRATLPASIDRATLLNSLA